MTMDHIDSKTGQGQVTNNTQERNEIRRQNSSVGMVPGLIGLGILLVVGLIIGGALT